MRTLLKITTLCLLAACINVAVAEAEACGALETVADGYCDAYCEALDCDGQAQGTADACVAVFDAFKKEAGTAPPCEADLVCPCMAEFDDFADLVDQPAAVDRCGVNADGTRFGLKGLDRTLLVDQVQLKCGVRGTTPLSLTYEETRDCWRRLSQTCSEATGT